MAKNKHLSLSERITIEKCLNEAMVFNAIARKLNRDSTTISKEVRNHMIFKKTGAYGRPFNDCMNRQGCTNSGLCKKPNCSFKYCFSCSNCYLYCDDYFKQYCNKLNKPPYVCNGCESRSNCTLEKRIYSAVYAQKEYESILRESRTGVCITEDEAIKLDEFISPLIKQGQSIHHICTSQLPSIMFSEKTIYNYIDNGVLSVCNLDLPRKVKFKPRKKNKHDSFKIDKGCRIGRTYKDFLDFMEGSPDCPIVQMDSVEGKKGGKVLLTIHFVNSEFMLAFLRDRNTAASVFYIFEQIYKKLTPNVFMQLFKVILTDNGSEFSDPVSIEMDDKNYQRTRIFYCDPSAPYQKGAIENNNSFIRRILPKGISFDWLTQEKVDLMMNHINSYRRASLGNRSPYEIFSYFYGKDILDVLGAALIPPNDIILRPELLK